MKINIEISDQRIEDLIETAFESVGYWASFDPGKSEWASIKKIDELKKGASAKVYDCETDELLGEWNYKNLKRGMKLFANGRTEKGVEISRVQFTEFLRGDEDIVTGDIFLQLAILGDIVFG